MNSFIKDLQSKRADYKIPLPGIPQAKNLADKILALLFPHFSSGSINATEQSIREELNSITNGLEIILRALEHKFTVDTPRVLSDFAEALPVIHTQLWQDAEAILSGDPAARAIDEVILAYPGFFAIAIYRISHQLHLLQVPVLPRLLTEYAHRVTGIDIHPGASIGGHFFIDHGTGIVIGETTVIKDHVKIYQGVTLGALSVEKGLANSKRHPTIEDNVVIYSNATILGGDTVIGKNSIIGGNVWLTSSVPPESLVYHKSDVKVKNTKQ